MDLDYISLLRCKGLKWNPFDIHNISDSLVFGGNDSFGNRFYVCRTSLGNASLAGHFFQGMCYCTHQGREVALNEFHLLTDSSYGLDGYRWHSFNTSYGIPTNVVTTRVEPMIRDQRLIGRCLIKYMEYESQVIGTIEKSESNRVLDIAFNGLRISCDRFQMLLCLK